MTDGRPPIYRITEWVASRLQRFREEDDPPHEKPARWELWAMVFFAVVLAVAAVFTRVD